MIHSSEVFADGYALMVYDISHDHQTFAYRDRYLVVPFNSVPTVEYKGWPACAKIEDVERHV